MVYDFVIIGAGAAGLMLADAMGSDPYFSSHSILLLDKNIKNTNDRTWCFWENGKGSFDPIVSHSWEKILFAGPDFQKQINILPYTYKLVRGIEFYSTYLTRISNYDNISFKQEEVLSIDEHIQSVQLTTKVATYTTKQVFSSLFDSSKLKAQNKYPLLHQHFIGWFVKTKRPVFTKDTATLMDFTIAQANNTRFMYVLPFSETEALVEYTLFSEQLLAKNEYEQAIASYIQQTYGCNDYQIQEREQGSIPMSSFKFSALNTKRIYYIGTAGGWTKSSTGYTFYNTAKNVAGLIGQLKRKEPLQAFVKKRFRFYDVLLLDVLFKNNATGYQVFQSLFQRKSPQSIFKFLDEETTIWEDLSIIWACPKKEFILALMKRFF